MYKPLHPLLDRFQLDLLDDQPHKLPQWSRTEALAAMNRSPHVVLYNGYGNADMLMRMRSTDLTRLTNQWPFLVQRGMQLRRVRSRQVLAGFLRRDIGQRQPAWSVCGHFERTGRLV